MPSRHSLHDEIRDATARNSTACAASFRDPSGFVFFRDGIPYRQVNRVYEADFRHLMSCGLYDALTAAGLLIRHTETDVAPRTGDAWQVIRPEPIPFISYAYEWCFSQLREAALATLDVQERAVSYGMVLKDASAFNVQFTSRGPVLIDTLSFTKYEPGLPWAAYRQFCQHFLAPLALMSYRDARLSQLFRSFIDGIPLDLAACLLPWRTLLSPSLVFHLHLHARAFRWGHRAAAADQAGGRKFSRHAMLGLISTLRSCIQRMRSRRSGSTWSAYYDQTNYSEQALTHKETLVDQFLREFAPRTVWDLGGNTGRFARVAARHANLTICFEVDHEAVDANYQQCRADSESRLLPLWLDLFNPSPGIGWAHRERMSLVERGPADVVLALALVHHLAISNNLPFSLIGDFLRQIGKRLIVEFVPQEDSQVQRMLAGRADIAAHYTKTAFEQAFQERFHIRQAVPIAGTLRTLYQMEARG